MVQKMSDTDLLHVMEICCLLEMQSLIDVCLKEVASILNVGNFSDLYQIVVASDEILFSQRLLRQVFNHFYCTHDASKFILEKHIKNTLISEFNAPKISLLTNYMEKIQPIKSKCFQTGEMSDFAVKSKEGYPFSLHKCIIGNIEYFDSLLKHLWDKNEVQMLPFSTNTLKICFGFVYDGQTFLKDVPFLTLFEIYAFAQFTDQVLFDELKKSALFHIDSFSAPLEMVSKVSPEELVQVYNDEHCGDEIKERVRDIMMKKMDKESSLLWVRLFAQYDITKEMEPELWKSLEIVLDKNVFGMYLIMEKLMDKGMEKVMEKVKKENEIEKLRKEIEMEKLKKEIEELKKEIEIEKLREEIEIEKLKKEIEELKKKSKESESGK